MSLRDLCASLLALCLLVPAAGAAAQEDEPPASTFAETVRVEVVNVEVFVTDRDGRPVTDLTAEDFTVFEDGRPRPIVNFYTEAGSRPWLRSPQPPSPARPGAGSSVAGDDLGSAAAAVPAEQRLHLLVFIDGQNLRPAHKDRVFRRLREFLATLPPSALVSVVSAGRSLKIHSDFLADRGAVGRILDEVEGQASARTSSDTERRLIVSELFEGETYGQRTDRLHQGSLQSRIRAYVQSEYDRGRVALQTLTRFVATLGGVPGRRALLYVSDGIPKRPGEDLYTAWAGGSESFDLDVERELLNFDLLPQFQELARQANAARVTVYSLDAVGDHRSEVRSAGGCPATSSPSSRPGTGSPRS